MKPSKKSQEKWLVTDELWAEIEPLIPTSKRKTSVGRPHVSDRQVMNGILFVLKTGCQWRALDVTGICRGSTAHKYFQIWREAGVFRNFWKKELERYDRNVGIDWKWQSLDASFVKVPVAGSKKNRKKSHGQRENRR